MMYNRKRMSKRQSKGAGEMALSMKCLPWKHEVLSVPPRTHTKNKAGCDSTQVKSSTVKVKTGSLAYLVSFRPVREPVSKNPELYTKAYST